MNEETALEILSKYLENNNIGFSSNVSDKHHLLLPSDPMSSRKYIVFKKNNLYFIAYDSYSTKAYDSETFTGLFGVIDLPDTFNLRLYKKEWVDIIFRTNKRKTGDLEIDKNVTITSSLKVIPSSLFSKDVVDTFLDLNKEFVPFRFIIENDFMPFVKELKGKMLVGIQTDNWVYLDNQVETLLEKGELLINSVIKNASTINT